MSAEKHPCPDCPDGYVWNTNGQTNKECPTCKGNAFIWKQLENNDVK